MEGRKEPDSGFEIDGRRYPVPTFETFTMDEAQVLYDYSGLAIEDFAAPDPDASVEEQAAHEAEIIRKAKNPAFKAALAHIAYVRGNPEISESRAREVIGDANLIGIALALVGDDAGDPTRDSPTEPESELDIKTPARSEGFGSHSLSDSDGPESPLGPIGTSELDTSPISVPMSSEA